MPSTTRLRRHPSGPPAAKVRGRAGGIGRSNSAEAERVSDDLRRHTGSYLTERRGISGLGLIGSAALAVVTAYQTGVIRRVPEPAFPFLGADAVDASGEAYQLLKTPDGALGMASYATTIALAGMGAADRHRSRPWLPLLLVAKAAYDAAGGAYLTAEQLSKHRKVCGWCVIAAGAGVGMLPLAVPEALAALRAIRRRH